jgi:hypothetical protein
MLPHFAARLATGPTGFPVGPARRYERLTSLLTRAGFLVHGEHIGGTHRRMSDARPETTKGLAVASPFAIQAN